MLFFSLMCFPKLRKQWATCERFSERPSAKETKNELHVTSSPKAGTPPAAPCRHRHPSRKGWQYRGAPARCGRSGGRSRGSTPAARPRGRTPGTGNPRWGRCAAPWTPSLSPRTHPRTGWRSSCGTAAGSPGVRNPHPPAETFTASKTTPLAPLSLWRGTAGKHCSWSDSKRTSEQKMCLVESNIGVWTNKKMYQNYFIS